MLKNKKILLGVCGSISFYKAYEILSHLKKLGADVYVALSDGALKFCSVAGWEALTPHPILSSQTEDWQAGISHISYAKMDLILLAPASVNTINRLANGICDNVFMQTLIASNAPFLIAPAANNKMLEHFSTQKSIEFLKASGVNFIEPIKKTLACGDVGKGALAEVEDIIAHTIKALTSQKFIGKKVIITGGATSEKIDDVRAITNFSSGKMARAMADAFFYAGATVCLATSIKDTKAPYQIINFTNTKELLDICQKECKNADILVACAAVSDYVSKQNFKGKLKKSELGDEWNLTLTKNIDVLASLNSSKCKKIGFKLETDPKNAIENAKDMLDKKGLDGVCLNIINHSNNFGSEQNEISFITKDSVQNFTLQNKNDLAKKLVELLA
ncbi:bifunctional phosphopantothenoylcysteine decarboxylase/phosphopantothenate--cysteine ligase CoaBC [Campylobacter suis]|uniref:Coenzyme A biosynthesis bifunctional protein CoaBC n=1 Tax=Campylobacter suis TaxID=2790657 RepID=A0ABM8Q1Q6_9BACT|nr:bifunctional phosphopantothenoylcysteine decarboxylase/phosphopantothenate--cysteine ligase CoaBC [Campylobacter suis]CAD7286771.1 Coenzyme A biosynthesis bifunctional protein CoaBC [Campylobacter suis]